MTANHLDPDALNHLLENHLDKEAWSRALLHLIAVCPECRKAGGAILDLYEAGAVDLDLCPIAIGLARSRAEAPALFAELEALPLEARRKTIESDPQWRSWGLCEHLSDASERAAAEDPKKAVHFAELAVVLSLALEEWEPAEQLWLDELRANAYAYLGNAQRVSGDLRAAEQSFLQSDRWWSRGGTQAGDVLGYEARILDLKASLRRAQRRLPESLELLEEALAAPEITPEMRGRVLIKKAKTLEEVGEVDRAIGVLRDAVPLVEEANDPRLLLCATHNLMWLLAIAGRHLEAHLLVRSVSGLTASAGGRLDLLRLRWVEAQIAAGFGHLDEAVKILEEVRQEFASQNLGYDAALVGLELATLRLREGRLEEVKILAREALPLFASQGVTREVLGAATLFLQAAEAETLTDEVARQVLEFVRRERSSPARSTTKEE
ncbi:MAG TPA: hypothetical protein VEL74_22840 [Thermoanaerobaculia bacterium]|nr:hypothetical protein [Thermoanaerobaculia bacterium]